MSEFDDLVAGLQVEGARAYSTWNPQSFSFFAEQRVPILERLLLAKQPRATEAERLATIKGFLQVVAEGIGQGWIKETPHLKQNTLLEYLLWVTVPLRLPELPLAEQLPTLARIWNLCEGLSQQPAWVERFVLSHRLNTIRLEKLEQFLIATLEPIFTPQRTIRWQGRWQTSVISPRYCDDEFLPGRMTLIAPMVVQIEDRERSLSMGVMLRPEGKSSVFGPIPCSFETIPPIKSPPKVTLNAGKVEVAGRNVDVPRLESVHSWTISETGYLVMSAIDSQRLWVLECDA